MPRRWDIGLIRRFTIVFGLVSAAFDYLTFGILLVWVKATPVVFRTAWFLESLLTELVMALVVRTRLPFYRSVPGNGLLVSPTLAIGALTLALPYLPYRGLLALSRWTVG